MERRDLLINLTLLTAICALAFTILQTEEPEEEIVVAEAEAADVVAPDVETDFDPEVAQRKFPNFGEKTMFQPLLTPTPPPPTPTPTPTPTPDIKAALGAWTLSTVGDGEALIEDKNQKNPEEQFFSLRVGQTRGVEVEKGVVRDAKLKKIDENSDNPSATFTLEGTSEEYTLKMFQ